MNQTTKDKYDAGPKSFGLSVRNSFVDFGDKTIPGPGTHQNVRMNKTNPPQWRMGKSAQRDTFLDKFHFQYPPSNNYDPKIEAIHPKLPNYSIPKANDEYLQKHKDENNSLLYEPDYNLGKKAAPKFTMGYFEGNDYSKPIPAPNQYFTETQKSFFNRTQKSFSVSQRPPPYGQEGKFPGPTKYHIQNYQHPSIRFSIGNAERPQVIVGKDAPGVFYQIRGNMTKTNTVKTIMKPYFPNNSKDLGDNQNNDSPSPDKYTPIYQKSKRSIITTYANRAPLQNTAVLNYPNPQKYNTQTDFYKKKSYSFTKDVRDRNYMNQTPGPGTHEIQAELGTKSGIMGKKLKQDVKFITPAADHYEPKITLLKKSSPSVINYYSNRVDFSKSLTGQKIGPGYYQIEKRSRAQMGKISKSLKYPKNSNKNPGPGSYDISGGIGKLPQYYTGSKKLTKEGFLTFTLQKWEKQKSKLQNTQTNQVQDKNE